MCWPAARIAPDKQGNQGEAYDYSASNALRESLTETHADRIERRVIAVAKYVAVITRNKSAQHPTDPAANAGKKH